MKLSGPQSFLLTSSQDICLFLAGVGSGKTFGIGVKSLYLIKNYPHVFGFIGANTYNQLTTSTMFRVREIWYELAGWKEGVHYVVNKKPPKSFNTTSHNFDDYGGIISFYNGCVVFKGSLDNAKAHDGKEFGWACLDETKDSSEEAVKSTILTRLRMPGLYMNKKHELVKYAYEEDGETPCKPYNPLLIFTSPAKVDWINDWFEIPNNQFDILSKIFNKEEFYTREWNDKCLVISSTYHNEENLPDGFIDRILSNTSKTEGEKLIYGNPFVKSGGEFYSSFDRMKHVKEFDINPELPLHISFDQNVNPYITMTIFQIEVIEEKDKIRKVRNIINIETIKRSEHVTEVRQIDEICLPNPRNKTRLLCLEFIKRYGRFLRINDLSLFYYGDPAGKHSDTRSVEHDYNIIERILKRYLTNASNRVPYKHPGVIKRRDFINNIFDEVYDIRFIIHPRCKKSIKDFEFLKEDINGKKHKERVKDPLTKVSYEKYGHTSDSTDYFLCEAFKDIYQREFR